MTFIRKTAAESTAHYLFEQRQKVKPMGAAEKAKWAAWEKQFGQQVEAAVCSDPALEAGLVANVRRNAAQEALGNPRDAASIRKRADNVINGAQAECAGYRSAHKNDAQPAGVVPPVTKGGNAAPNGQQPARQPER
jgi:hypothetical protein